MHSIPTHIALLRNRIAKAASAAGRRPADVRLVAVSKARSVREIESAIAAGVIDFGENYLQEALPKIAAIGARGIVWHFVGAIQTNKTRDIAGHFQWVHTVDRAKIARRLSDQRPPSADALDVLVQVNIDDEPQKAGVSAATTGALVAEVAELPRLRLRGLMAVPKPRTDATEQYRAFARLTALFEAARPANAERWDTLSMGMSDDFVAAIEAGSTLVRIGTAIFGERNARAAS